MTVQLPNGETRKIQREEVLSIQYVSDAPGAGAPATTGNAAPAAGSPTPSPVPIFYTAPESSRRSKGLMITGIVLMPVGAVATALGGVVFASSFGEPQLETHCTDISTTPPTGCTTSEQSHDDDGMRHAGIALMVGGGVALAGGIVFTAFGASKKPSSLALTIKPGQIALRHTF